MRGGITMITNPCLRIIEENCLNYKERRKLYETLEAYGNEMNEKMITNLYELEKAYPKNIKIKEENNE